jgi:hypothetical protein
MKTTLQKSYGNSSFWLDWEDDEIVSEMNDTDKKSYNLYKLAAAKRAISNFVNIVTNKDIPVTYIPTGNSYTDGKSITIGANVEEPADFDISVGLSLHEASHIILSDMNILKKLADEKWNSLLHHTGIDVIDDKLIRDTEFNDILQKVLRNVNSYPIQKIKDLLNWVEDRRIDQFIYSTSPGYRDYYKAMYDKYFNAPIIDKALKSSEYRSETFDSYMFRIVNITNPNTDLYALRGLKEIWNTLNLNKISRLKSTDDSLSIAVDIFKIIINNLSQSSDQSSQTETDSNTNESNSGMTDNSNDDSTDQENKEDDSQDSDDSLMNDKLMVDDHKSLSSPSMEINSDQDFTPSSNQNLKDLNKSDKTKLEKQIKKQNEFINGNVKKRTIKSSEFKDLNVIEESGSTMVSVGSDYSKFLKPINAILVKKMTRSLIESEQFPLTKRIYNGEVYMAYQDQVNRGIQLGTILGKKLQVRSESKTTIYNRQKVGKIDKRMLSSLGFGNENVFTYLETDSYKKANLHISLDGSASMDGTPWGNSITNIVALCKAVDMIPNLEIQVSIRGTTDVNQLPYIVMAYDSTVDKFSKVKQLFPYLHPSGCTPEGLAFETLLDYLKPTNQDMDSYFLNISDGEPYFPNKDFFYAGGDAAEHTARVVKKIEKMGINILSYFVSDHPSEISSRFKLMYGKYAVGIDVTNISQITKTMNNLFLQK